MNPFRRSTEMTRRSFLARAGCAGIGATTVSNTIRDLRLINTAMAADPPAGYKALVCLFLNGGNDSNNWLVPTETSTFDAYTSIRGNLALPMSSLLPLRTGTSQSDPLYSDAAGHTYGFHPSSGNLQRLFGEGKLAAVMNIGTILRPITRAQYTANLTGTRPPQLFSHSDQITQWQTSIPDQPPATGWGGRVADLLNSVYNPSGRVSMSISLAGANTFEVGNLISQYHVATTGAVTLSNLTGARFQTLRDILAQSSVNLQRSAFAEVTDRAIETGDLLNNNIAATIEVAQGGSWTWNEPFPTSGLGSQMKMIARLIQARGPAAFNMSRQIFFCQLGGYDTHTSQVLVNGVDDPVDPGGAHYRLLADVNACMFAFQRAMEQLGVGNDVTTFTASDFSRTLPTNSQGSDHGWGSHHLVMGGAVKGGQMYGKLPTFAINGPDDTGLGRWIPTLAVDQYAATLAKWFGVSDSDMSLIFPNLSRFGGTQYGSNIGFML